MRSTTLSTALLILTVPAIARVARADDVRVLVLPYQAVHRASPASVLHATTELVTRELASQGIDVVPLRVAPASPDEEVEALLERAASLTAARDVNGAIAATEQAIARLEASPLVDVATYADAQHRLAQLYMWAARDDDARSRMVAVAAIAPRFAPRPDAYSRLYRRWLRDAAEVAARGGARGTLVVETTLPGSVVRLDGREMGVAPIQMLHVAAGRHVVGVEAGAVRRSQVVDVVEGREITLRLDLAPEGVGEVVAAVADNRLDVGAIEYAADVGRTHDAQFVVVGAVSSDGAAHRVVTYVVDVSRRTVATTPGVALDTELLTAEADVIAIASAVRRAVADPSEGLAVARLVEDVRPRERRILADAAPLPPPSRPATAQRGPARAIVPIRPYAEEGTACDCDCRD